MYVRTICMVHKLCMHNIHWHSSYSGNGLNALASHGLPGDVHMAYILYITYVCVRLLGLIKGTVLVSELDCSSVWPYTQCFCFFLNYQHMFKTLLQSNVQCADHLCCIAHLLSWRESRYSVTSLPQSDGFPRNGAVRTSHTQVWDHPMNIAEPRFDTFSTRIKILSQKRRRRLRTFMYLPTLGLEQQKFAFLHVPHQWISLLFIVNLVLRSWWSKVQCWIPNWRFPPSSMNKIPVLITVQLLCCRGGGVSAFMHQRSAAD